MRFPILIASLLVPMVLVTAALDARTVWRCVRGGTVSLSTEAEPGSKCKAYQLDDHAALPRHLQGPRRGTLYSREQDGHVVHGTRRLPGAVATQSFALPIPPGSSAHGARRNLGRPRLDVYVAQFRSAARATGLDEAWLRTIAHVESAFNATAVSRAGAQGVMQLMPLTARGLRVNNPFDPSQSIMGGARHLKALQDRYPGDRKRIAAAYNAGAGAVDRYGGIPPYAETRDYVGKVLTLYARYLSAIDKRQ
jgi:hypothetical protein